MLCPLHALWYILLEFRGDPCQSEQQGISHFSLSTSSFPT